MQAPINERRRYCGLEWAGTSSTVMQEGRLLIGQLPKALDCLCFIYDVDHRNLAREHELGTGEDLSGKVGFVPADPHYNI